MNLNEKRMNVINKRDQEETNPCHQEHELSLKCLDKNGYNQDSCLQYFENYRNCKKFWHDVYNDRRKKGIKPFLPAPEERLIIKQEYLSTSKRK